MTVLITGGSRGIGAATVRRSAKEGYAVAINYNRSKDAAEALVQEIRNGKGRACAVRADISDDAEIVRMFEETERQLGPISALVNNAGIDGCHLEVENFDGNTLRRLFNTNVVGTMMCCREVARRMSTAVGGRGGVIVNVTSMAATIGGRARHVDYAAAKAAIDTLTIGLAKELGPQGIRVNSVRPGSTVTDMTSFVHEHPKRAATVAETIPMNRFATADEVANPIVWLLSDEASFVSGCRLDVSGGGFLIR